MRCEPIRLPRRSAMVLISGRATMTVQRLVGQHAENFEGQTRHGATDDVAEAQCVMYFAAKQRRHRHLTAHLNQQRLEVFVFEKTFHHGDLRRQESVAAAAIGDDNFIGAKRRRRQQERNCESEKIHSVFHNFPNRSSMVRRSNSASNRFANSAPGSLNGSSPRQGTPVKPTNTSRLVSAARDGSLVSLFKT